MRSLLQMRFSLSKAVTGLSVIVFILFLWLVFNKINNKTFTQTCNRSEKFHEGLHNLAERTHTLLKTTGLTHFLCYGSLWGQLRQSRSLPWESDIEMCLLNEELAVKDEVYLVRIFRNNLMNLDYDSAEGVYVVTDKSLPGATVQLIVFEHDPALKMVRRVGWKRRVLPPDCSGLSSLACFPQRLIKQPLPLREFGPSILPVPREGIEIQKYHYPTNWWKQILPKNC